MDLSPLVFYPLATMILFFGFMVVWTPNPIYSAFSLVLTMIGLALTYLMLKAPFIASMQMAVYAGAVTVLFVMVVMLFDLAKERDAFSKGLFSGMLKIFSAGGFLGLMAGVIAVSSDLVGHSQLQGKAADLSSMFATKKLAITLFTKYLFAFEALGLLLLLIAIGVVAVSRIKGGTHAKH